MRTSFDVIVVGGGPAGSTAARRAAQHGVSVLLLDSATFPRSKPCGGAVSEQAMSYLDFALDPRLFQRDIFGARVHFQDRTIEARKPSRIAVLTSRSELDNYLLSKASEAGVNVRQNARVIRTEANDHGVSVRTSSQEFQGKFLIGADGAQSVVAKLIRPRLPRFQYAVTFECDVPSDQSVSPDAARELADIYFGTAYMGYGWVFSKRDHWNVGLGALASRARNIKAAALKFRQDLADKAEGVAGEPRNAVGWIVPAGGYRRTVSKGPIMLAGDAAGFVDPFTGEGIACAIRSGAAAGTMAARGARGLDTVKQAAAAYSSFCRRAIEADLWYGLQFARLLHAWPNGLLRLLATNCELFEKYLDVSTARLTYRQYFRWFLPRALAGMLRDWPPRSHDGQIR